MVDRNPPHRPRKGEPAVETTHLGTRQPAALVRDVEAVARERGLTKSGATQEALEAWLALAPLADAVEAHRIHLEHTTGAPVSTAAALVALVRAGLAAMEEGR